MNNSRSDVLMLAGRVLLATVFIQGGFSKLVSMDGSIAYSASAGLPAPAAAYWVAVIVELGGGLAVLLGFRLFWHRWRWRCSAW